MDDHQSTYVEEVMPVVLKYARRAFGRRMRDRADRINDALSTAFEIWKGARDKSRAFPQSIAWYAIRRVKSRRRFRLSGRCLDGYSEKGELRGQRDLEFDLRMAFRVGDNPADIAALRIDFPRWLRRLNARQRKVCKALLAGFTTKEVAGLLGITQGRVSQIRWELVGAWEEFTA